MVEKANADGVIRMKANGALTQAGRDVYKRELKEAGVAGVRSAEALIEASKKSFAEATKKFQQNIATARKNLVSIKAISADCFTSIAEKCKNLNLPANLASAIKKVK